MNCNPLWGLHILCVLSTFSFQYLSRELHGESTWFYNVFCSVLLFSKRCNKDCSIYFRSVGFNRPFSFFWFLFLWIRSLSVPLHRCRLGSLYFRRCRSALFGSLLRLSIFTEFPFFSHPIEGTS